MMCIACLVDLHRSALDAIGDTGPRQKMGTSDDDLAVTSQSNAALTAYQMQLGIRAQDQLAPVGGDLDRRSGLEPSDVRDRHDGVILDDSDDDGGGVGPGG